MQARSAATEKSSATSDKSSRSLSLRTNKDREVAGRETGIENNKTNCSECKQHFLHHRQQSLNTSTSGNSERDRHWRTILGHPPHMTSSTGLSTGHQPGQVAEHRRGLQTTLWIPRSRSNASELAGLPPLVRRRPVDALVDSSMRLPSREQPLRPFACDQCVRRFERRGHLKVSLGSLLIVCR